MLYIVPWFCMLIVGDVYIAIALQTESVNQVAESRNKRRSIKQRSNPTATTATTLQKMPEQQHHRCHCHREPYHKIRYSYSYSYSYSSIKNARTQPPDYKRRSKRWRATHTATSSSELTRTAKALKAAANARLNTPNCNARSNEIVFRSSSCTSTKRIHFSSYCSSMRIIHSSALAAIACLRN